MSMLLTTPPADAIPVAESDDADLLRRFAEHQDREAVGVLFRRHADAVYRMAWRHARNEADAEDIVQTAFVQILRKPGQYRGESSVRAWIMGIVVNVTRMKCRGESRRRDREDRVREDQDGSAPLPSSTADPASLDNRELQSAILRAVETLPERYRLPLWLHYLEGFVFKDVATVLAVPEKTVRSQIRRALLRLRRAPAVAPYSLGVLGIAALLSSVPVHAAPIALKAALPGLIAAAFPAAAGSAMLVKMVAGLETALRLVKGAVTTKASLGIGTAAAVLAGSVFWLSSQGPVVGAARATASGVSFDPGVSATAQPSVPGLLHTFRDGREPGSAVTLLPDVPLVGDDGAGVFAGDEVGTLRDPDRGVRVPGGLPARDRGAVRQVRAERCPAEYSAMFEQYMKNISDGAVASSTAQPVRPISFKP
jgi:RNA polymerase sigma factor (sigma-70 family)